MKTYVFIIIIGIFLSNSVYAQFAGGDGSKSNPYQISSAEQLSNIRHHLNSYFIQINDIDLENFDHYNDGKGWLPIGGAGSSDSFSGNYDGQNYTISNLNIRRHNTDNIGLFGLVGIKSSGQEVSIKNIGIKGANINGDNGVGVLIGGLISNKKTLIEFAYISDGIVSGNGNIGGLIGYAHSFESHASTKERPTISKTFSNIDVAWAKSKSGNNFGGLIGYTSATNINNSYSRSSVIIDNTTANISSLQNVGGFIGDASNKTSISFCYSTGSVKAIGNPVINQIGGMIGVSEGNISISNSFWDKESSEQNNSDGGSGKTSDQMNNISTFSNFDFSNIWGIDSEINDGYPYLKGNKWDILPIELEYFKVEYAKNKVELKWATLSEINNDFFSIERSSDGVYFETIENIEGAGNSSKQITYFYTDENPTTGMNYYRLKQTDFDGNFEYFDIKSIEISKLSDQVSIYPNPSNGIFTISLSSKNQTHYSIMDYSGKIISYGQLSSLETNFDFSHISSGIYFLKIASITHKIIIK